MFGENNNIIFVLLLGLLFYFMLINKEHFITTESLSVEQSKVLSIALLLTQLQSDILSNTNIVASSLIDVDNLVEQLTNAQNDALLLISSIRQNKPTIVLSDFVIRIQKLVVSSESLLQSIYNKAPPASSDVKTDQIAQLKKLTEVQSLISYLLIKYPSPRTRIPKKKK